jgi:uncharacterized protein YndB with AHSA1/START domain
MPDMSGQDRGAEASAWWCAPSEVEVTTRATPEAVYALLEEPRTYPDWLVGAQAIRGVDPAFPAPGSTFDHRVGPSTQATVADHSEAIDADPPHLLSLRVHVGPVQGVARLVLDEVAPGRTRVRMQERPIGWAKALTPLLRPVLAARNRVSLQRLRALAESSP